MNADEIAHLRELITEYKKRLRELEIQSAQFGIDCPAHIKVEIKDIKSKVIKFERQIDNGAIESYPRGKNTLSQFGHNLVLQRRV